MKYHLLVKEDDLAKFKFCPMCGAKNSVIYEPGDYGGRVYCLECPEDDENELEIDFLIIEEYKARYPVSFRKLVDRF